MSQQVYRRIYAPYMPQGTPDKTNAPTPLYAPGELGYAFSDQNTGGEYLRVLLDSGATAATTVGAVAKGQIAYWKDQPNSIVTNDARFCDVGPTGAINRVAGVFQLVVTGGGGIAGADGNPLYYMCDLVIRRPQTPVLCVQALAGAQMVASQTANTPQMTYLTGVTTAPQSQVLGVCYSATALSAGLYSINVAIGFSE
jgi:hypothetical protein